ncbi:DUF222 domain-containing protein [Kribbella shirazensis]|uniref:DUF222 domain-containing protein n=1 Tax=Kribbella shirazensis TaxID=1105143 RepID=A0A7X5VE08_9ACTN|nr:hypothetical protein [Kribbella shirazensis]NIK58792.1 hypothetical protein [Kribbella shirazensis]
MFETTLDALSTRDLLEEAARCRAVANQADARLLECAQRYAERFHPSVCGVRPGRRVSDGSERAVVLGGDGCPEIAEFAIAEFAVVIGVSPGVGRELLGDALALQYRFPRTWAEILAGQATPWKARKIARACAKLDQAGAEYVDRRVAAIVDTISPYRLEKIVDAAKKCADPQAAAEEAAEAADKRGVYVGSGDRQGNKTIYVIAPAAAVNRHDAAVAGIAEALKALGDTRPIQRRRADAIGIIADPRFTQELLNQAHNQPSGQADDQPNHLIVRPNDQLGQPSDQLDQPSDQVVQPGDRLDQASDQVVRPGDRLDQPSDQLDRATGQVVQPSDQLHQPSDPLDQRSDYGLACSVDRHGSCDPPVPPARDLEDTVEPSGLLDVQEPVGPLDDPWLEDAGRDDPDPPADPFDRWAAVDAGNASSEPEDGSAMDAAGLRALDARLAQIKHDAYTNPSYLNHQSNLDYRSTGANADSSSSPESPGGPGPSSAGRWTAGQGGAGGSRHPAGGEVRPEPLSVGHEPVERVRAREVRPGKTEIIVHLTDHTLGTGSGVLRAETIGPLLASQLTELVGHGPYMVKPVIDLNDAVSVDAYEIPTRIRDRVKLMYPVELFPYGTRESSDTIDLDHIEPYDPHGPTGQTNTSNLAPLGRFGHRVKTHARGWSVRRVDHKTLVWTTPHGFSFRVDPTGTHRGDLPIGETAVRRPASQSCPGG